MGSSNGHANGDAMLRSSSTNGAIRAVASEPRTSKAKAAEQGIDLSSILTHLPGVDKIVSAFRDTNVGIAYASAIAWVL